MTARKPAKPAPKPARLPTRADLGLGQIGRLPRPATGSASAAKRAKKKTGR